MLQRRHLCATSLAILAALAPLALGCGGAADAVRPDAITAGEAVGEAFQCTEQKLREDLSPFTVDWRDGDRASLEAAMQRGVAVVKMTCEGPKILKACMVVGDYAYAGVSLKTKLVEMNDAGSAAINLGVSVSPAFRAEMAQGRSLMLAYSLAGTESTTVTTVGPWQLKGRCQGATHFVFGAQVGAFAMQSAEKGSASTAMDLLLASGSAQSSASKKTRTTDGDPKACEGATYKDKEKKAGCAALMRVDLMFIDPDAKPSTSEPDPKQDPVVRATGCPSGFVWGGAACEPAAKAKAKLCARGDAADCEAQCGRGSVDSCDRWAETLLDAVLYPKEDYETWQDGVVARGEAVDAWAPHIAKMSSTCAEGMPHACALMAYHWSNKGDTAKTLAAFGQACANGDSGSCYELGDVEPRPDAVLEADKAQRLPYLQIGCNRGMAIACGMWADLFVDDWTYDQLAFDPAVASMAARACYGGKTNYCAMAAAFKVTTEARCVDLMTSSSVKVLAEERARATKSCKDAVRTGVAQSDQEASLLLTAACDAGNKKMCEYMDANGLRIDVDKLAEQGAN